MRNGHRGLLVAVLVEALRKGHEGDGSHRPLGHFDGGWHNIGVFGGGVVEGPGLIFHLPRICFVFRQRHANHKFLNTSHELNVVLMPSRVPIREGNEANTMLSWNKRCKR